MGVSSQSDLADPDKRLRATTQDKSRLRAGLQSFITDAVALTSDNYHRNRYSFRLFCFFLWVWSECSNMLSMKMNKSLLIYWLICLIIEGYTYTDILTCKKTTYCNVTYMTIYIYIYKNLSVLINIINRCNGCNEKVQLKMRIWKS